MVDYSHYAPFTPSHRPAAEGTNLGPVDPAMPVHVSIYLKPLAEAEAPASREDMAQLRAKSYAPAIQLVTEFAAKAGLTVESVEPARRLVRVSGTAAQAEAAFRTTLSRTRQGTHEFRSRQGVLQLPQELHGAVEAVLGLDTRAQAQTRHITSHRRRAQGTAFRPNMVGQLYNFPTGVTGAGQCIGLIELGGGFVPSDTATAFAAMSLAPPKVTAVSVDGGQNTPTPDDGADGEVALDIQVAGGVAPGAAIAVYFAPNTDAGFADAISQAVNDTAHKPSVLSISWGSAESTWTAQGVAAMNSALQDAVTLGVSVFVASGDNLATDGVADGKVHVDFPAASPYAIGCGGTQLNVAGGAVSSEVVWNDGSSGTGGGVSALFPIPAFQAGVTLPLNVSTRKAGRGVPDVAGNAAPETGYDIVVNGQTEVVGGTSAVAPLWAGLTALVNQKATHAGGKPVGFFLPTLYKASGAVREITSGTNKPTGSKLGYAAGPGWNACTGLGVPNGAALLAALTGTAAS